MLFNCLVSLNKLVLVLCGVCGVLTTRLLVVGYPSCSGNCIHRLSFMSGLTYGYMAVLDSVSDCESPWGGNKRLQSSASAFHFYSAAGVNELKLRVLDVADLPHSHGTALHVRLCFKIGKPIEASKAQVYSTMAVPVDM